MPLKLSSKGFTFIELILYVAVVTIVVTALIPFAWNVIQGGVKSNTEQEVFSGGRFISERLKLEIRNALDINTASSNFDVNLADNPSYQLSLKAPSPNDPTIITISGNKVMIKQGTAAAVSLTPNDVKVTNLTLTDYSSADNKTKHIGLTLTVSANYPSTRQEFQETINLHTSAELRNN